MEEKKCEDVGIFWSDVASSQGMLENTKTGRGRNKICPIASEGLWSYQYLDFSLLAFRIVKEQIYVILSHRVYCSLLQQLRK